MARVQGQLSESVTVDSATHRRVVVEWSVAPSEVRTDEGHILRYLLRSILESRAGSEALNAADLFSVAAGLLKPLQMQRNDTAYVTVHAVGTSATAYITED